MPLSTTTVPDDAARDDDGWQMTLEVFDVLERHGFKRGSERDAAHSVVMLMTMITVYTGRA